MAKIKINWMLEAERWLEKIHFHGAMEIGQYLE